MPSLETESGQAVPHVAIHVQRIEFDTAIAGVFGARLRTGLFSLPAAGETELSASPLVRAALTTGHFSFGWRIRRALRWRHGTRRICFPGRHCPRRSQPLPGRQPPLAQTGRLRMRPRNLDAEHVGQSHILGHGQLLRRAYRGRPRSVVAYFLRSARHRQNLPRPYYRPVKPAASLNA